MNLSDLHRRLLADVLAIGSPYPLVITGGYAVQAHGLVDRLSQDLDVATENPAPMDEITRTVSDGLALRGWQVRQIETSPLSGRLIAADPTTGEECEIDILKEAFWSPPTTTELGPVLALDDVIGTKVRALATAARFATSSMSTPPPGTTPPPTWRCSAAAMPASSSTSATSMTASSAPSGGTTRTSPTTA